MSLQPIVLVYICIYTSLIFCTIKSMDLSTAVDNVKSSIDAYRKASTWIPNDDSNDNLLKTALNGDITWAGLGAVCANRSARMGYLQDPIRALSSPFETTTGMQFSTGTVGWWFSYGMDTTGKNGWLVIVFRYPTTGNSQTPASGDNAVYNVGGYIVSDGTRYPFSDDGHPLTCSGTYNSSTSPDGVTGYSLILTSTDFDSHALVSDFTLSLMDNGYYQLISEFADGGYVSLHATSKHAAVPHGDSKGCAPCVSGVGTNYWSWTYMTGQMQYNTASSTGSIIDVVAWFDHQWGSLSVAPRGALPQILASVSGMFKTSSPPSWFWTTVVLSDKLQYSCSITLPANTVPKKGSVYSSSTGAIKYAFDDSGNPTINFGLPVSIKVNSVLTGDHNLSSDVTVTVDGSEYRLKGIVSDGFVTLAGGSINQEVPCIAYDSIGNAVGSGFLEMNHMHSTTDNATDTLQVMGLDATQANLDVLKPRKYSFSQAWQSVAVVSVVLLVVLAVLGLSIWGIVKLV